MKDEIKNVWMVAWPLIITNILNVTVGLIDFKMVGVLGVASIAAVGMSRLVIMFLHVLMIAISGGSSVLIAHAYGAKNYQKVNEIASRSVFFMLIVSLVIVTPLGYFFSKGILILLGASEKVIDLGESYLHVIFLGSIFTMFNFALTGILLGMGKTKISLYLLLIVNFLNIFLNAVFIYGFGPIPAFGVTGAAMGTVFARGLGSFIGAWILITPLLPFQINLLKGFSFDWALLGKIIHFGGPRSLQGIIRNLARLFTIRIITLLPDTTRAISAYSLCLQIRMISSFIGLAFMSASMARVGQNIGAKRPDIAVKSGWISAGMAAFLMSFIACFFFLFPEAIMAFFTKDHDVIMMGRLFFLIIALTEPVMAFAYALSGALRGGGDPISPFIYAGISEFIIAVALGYYFAIVLNFGFVGIALGIAVSTFTHAIPLTLTFWIGCWKRIKV